jgi:hypothetical protein
MTSAPSKKRSQYDSAANRNGLSRRQWKLAAKQKRDVVVIKVATDAEGRKSMILSAIARFKEKSGRAGSVD